MFKALMSTKHIRLNISYKTFATSVLACGSEVRMVKKADEKRLSASNIELMKTAIYNSKTILFERMLVHKIS
jgi:hypothetical protein